MSDNITILEKYFNPLYFNVYEPYPGKVVVSSVENPNNQCLELNIQGNYMKVEYIGKCNYRINGTQIMGIIQKFVRDKGCINLVELQDTSSLLNLCNRYDIPLYIIYILSTGKSWYNSYGYKSVNYANEIRHNKQLLDMNIIDFIIECNRRRGYKIGLFYNVMNEHQYYKDNKKRTRLNPQMTVVETFTRIKKYLLKNMPEVKEVGFELSEYCYALKWIMDLVHKSNIIFYNSTTLTWSVSRSFSGRKSSHKIASSVRKGRSTEYKKTNISRNNTLKRRSI